MRALAWPAAAGGVVAAVHLWLTSAMSAPIIMADEYGYLGAARRIIGSSPQTHVPYRPGVGLLYVPAALIADGPLGTYRGALVTNAVLAGLLAVAAWWVAGLFGALRRPPVRFATACAVGVYTSFLGFSSLASPEIALAALELALVGITARAVTTRSVALWALAGTGAGATWLLHPRGAGVTLGLLVVALVALRPYRANLVRLVALAVPIAIIVPLTSVLADWVSGPVFDPRQYDSGLLARSVLDAHGLHNAVITTFGQVFYLAAATLGLAVAGVVELARALRGRPRRLDLLFPLAAFAGVFAVSIVTNARAVRADHFMYGRYDEGAVAPLMIAGIAMLAAAEGGAMRRRYVAIVGGAMLAAAAAFLVVAGSARLHLAFQPIAALGTDPLRRRIGWPDPLVIGSVTFVVIYLLAAARALGRVVPVAAVALVFVAFGAKNTRNYFQPGSTARAGERVLATTMNRLDAEQPIGCVAYDTGATAFFHRANYQLFAPLQYRLFDAARQRPCGDVVISGRRLDQLIPGARMIVPEKRVRQALWVLPGERLERLAAQGRLLPADAAQLPALASATVTATARGTGTADVTVQAGPGTPLPAAPALAWPGPVAQVVGSWDGGPPTAGSDLPGSLLPGDTARVTLAVPAPASKPLAPGSHQLVLAVRVGDRVVATTRVPVTVP